MRYTKFNNKHLDYMIERIETNSKITHEESVIGLVSAFELKMSLGTIYKHLDTVIYILRYVRINPETANVIKNKIKKNNLQNHHLHINRFFYLFVYEENEFQTAYFVV
ncbi:hypothetical protein CDIK_3679 [Cucumispora dikerogammari]|nr:hypothetical protein CDIK_3679 [Cucumispora dikerogammari]